MSRRGCRPASSSQYGGDYLQQRQDRLVEAAAAAYGVEPERVGRVPLPVSAPPAERPAVAPRLPSRQVSLEDSAARVISAQYGVPIDDVMVNGRRYGDIVRARQH